MNEADLKLAVRLAILPRTLVMMQEKEDEKNAPPKPSPLPQPEKSEKDDDLEDEDDDSEEPEQEEEEEEEEEAAPGVPEEFMFDPEGVILDHEMLDVGKSQKHGKAGGWGLVFSQYRGRYIKAMFPRGGGVQLLADDAILRASGPYQKVSTGACASRLFAQCFHRRERHEDHAPGA